LVGAWGREKISRGGIFNRRSKVSTTRKVVQGGEGRILSAGGKRVKIWMAVMPGKGKKIIGKEPLTY